MPKTLHCPYTPHGLMSMQNEANGYRFLCLKCQYTTFRFVKKESNNV